MIRIPPAELGQHTGEVLAEIAHGGARRRKGPDADPAEVADHVARVTIDRPEVLNAIDAAAEHELQDVWARSRPTATCAASC